MNDGITDIGEKAWQVKARIKFSLAVIFICALLTFNWKVWTVYLFENELKLHFPRNLAMTLIEAAIGAILIRLPVNKYYMIGMMIVAFAIGTAISVDLRPYHYDYPLLKYLIFILWAVGIFIFPLCMGWLFRELRQNKIYLRWRKVTYYFIALYLYMILIYPGLTLNLDLADSTIVSNIFKILALLTGFKVIDAFLESIILKWENAGLINYVISKSEYLHYI